MSLASGCPWRQDSRDELSRVRLRQDVADHVHGQLFSPGWFSCLKTKKILLEIELKTISQEVLINSIFI